MGEEAGRPHTTGSFRDLHNVTLSCNFENTEPSIPISCHSSALGDMGHYPCQGPLVATFSRLCQREALRGLSKSGNDCGSCRETSHGFRRSLITIINDKEYLCCNVLK